MKKFFFLKKTNQSFYLLLTLFLVIGVFLSSCDNESLDDFEPESSVEIQPVPPQPTGNELPAITEFLDIPDNQASLRNYTVVFNGVLNRPDGWNLLYDGGAHPGKDIKVSIRPRDYSAGLYAREIPGYENLGEISANAWQTVELEVLHQNISPGEKVNFFVWSSNSVTYDVVVSVRDAGNGNSSCGLNAPNCNATAPNFPSNTPIGIDAGNPITIDGGTNLMNNDEWGGNTTNGMIASSNAQFVRLNFFRPTNYGQNNDGWLDTYDDIVCHFNSNNIPIYAVITDVVGGDGSHVNGYVNTSDKIAWINNYVNTFEKIVQRYCGKIHVYESYNEPNTWISGTNPNPKMSQSNFAYLLNEVYNRVKPGGSNPYDITVVTGPLEANDTYTCGFTYDGAANYFVGVLNFGVANYNWDQNNNNFYPFDGVGYHIYVRRECSGQFDLEYGIDLSLDAIWNKPQYGAIPNSRKMLYISEIGWNSERMQHPDYWDARNRVRGALNTKEKAQANFITRGLDQLKTNAWRVKAISHFSLKSFDNGESAGIEDFGLFRPSYLPNPGFKTPCWCVYQKMASGLSGGTARSQCGVGSY